ncbi:MAG: PHP domain-containing protein [Candidatus Eremiobacteraeota bacterium]|nr:PHP domain-containing protein [Candidatus Eremiobacteraeota bacterium]MBV8435229.1 PHP domain-containing protein [Candidatus Eremiobacteraeota bacterium]MBV8583385.1 PHP domain-containing protein [Candidatus Eremiobacteraeota bacterium]MBV8655169.1 PHP domain-containing protein [Candidatus Eremiobacteraeota bacterium]
MSDGTLTPQALADFMGERGVEAFCISDHDTLGAYGNFEAPKGSRYITGIEINTTWRENEVHVLGYNVPLGPSPINELLEYNQVQRRGRAQTMVDQLNAAGYPLTLQHVIEEAADADAVGRPHVAKALVRAGMTESVDSAFRDILRRGKPGYVPQHYTTPQKAIDTILEVGGIPVLAHPGRLKDRILIDELAGHGLRGLEVFYPLHDADDIAIFRDKAKQYGLVMTAGMDFHDIRYHTAGVGIDVDAGDIRPFLELAEAFA